eukprot:gene3714-6258_t
MASQDPYKVAKTRRGKKVLEERASKIVENPKTIIYLHGSKCPQLVQEVFKDLRNQAHYVYDLFHYDHDLLQTLLNAP